MPSESDNRRSATERALRIRAIAEDCMRRWTEGELLDLEAVAAAHPDLMPELAARLRPIRLLGQATALPDQTQRFASPSPLSRDRHATSAEDLPKVPHEEPARSAEPQPTASQPKAPPPPSPTLRDDSPAIGSGLHIRCPHCRYHVELLDDNHFDHLTCSTCGSVFSLIDSSERTSHAAPLTVVGHFELVSRLGTGSFGTVWKAYDVELDRSVAIKIPRRGQLDPLGEAQFLREARVAAQLRHPNIVRVYEVGREGDLLYIVSDLIRGVTLHEWLAVKRPSPRETAELVAKIADALHHAHEQGVVHRDLKPSNVLLDQHEEPQLTDFGLAKRDMGEITMTVDGQILGTPAYMSPEQAAGQAHYVDRRTDIYALGVVLFEMLTGELPFRGSVQMQLHQKLADDAPNPRSLDRLIPRDLAVICARCLDREPNRRFSTAAEMAADLRRHLQGEPIRARPIGRLERLIRWSLRRPAAAAALTLTAILAVAGPATAWRLDRQRRALADLNGQNTRLIDDRDQSLANARREIGSLRQKNTRLAAELAAAGHATDPDWFWPPNQGVPPHRELLLELAKLQPLPDSPSESKATPRALSDLHATTSYVAAASPSNDELASQNLATDTLYAQACLQLGWGIVREQSNAHADATDHFQVARRALEELHRRFPTRTAYARALSDCYRRLGAASDRPPDEVRVAWLEKRRAIVDRLAADSHDPRRMADAVDAELRLAIGGGSQQGPDAVRRAESLHAQLQERLPLDPVSWYLLVCHLAGTEAILEDCEID